MKYPTNLVIQYPSGRWGFVGSVDVRLSYERVDGQPLTDQDIADLRQVGAGILRKRIKSISFASREEAEQAALQL